MTHVIIEPTDDELGIIRTNLKLAVELGFYVQSQTKIRAIQKPSQNQLMTMLQSTMEILLRLWNPTHHMTMDLERTEILLNLWMLEERLLLVSMDVPQHTS